MKPDLCTSMQAAFPDYLDGTLTGRAMQEIAAHLEGSEGPQGSAASAPCAVCADEFACLRRMQTAIAGVRSVPVPADLPLKLRLAISRERARRDARWTDTVSLAWDNAVRPMLLQVSAGVAGTIVVVGSIMLLLGMVASPPQSVMANDEPLGAITSPHYLYSTVAPGAIVTGRDATGRDATGQDATGQDATIVVEASIDSLGRVYDYAIVSGPQTEAVRLQVVDQLLASVFQPASVFGQPVRGRVVRTFSGISVHA